MTTQQDEIAEGLAEVALALRVGATDIDVLTRQVLALPAAAPHFVVGQTMPDASNVGSGILGPVTKAVTMALVIKQPTTFTDTRFENWVDIATPFARFVNCTFAGPATYTRARPLVKCTDLSIVQATFDFCTFAAQTPAADELDGIMGHSYRLNRCDLHHLDDGFGLNSPDGRPLNISVEGSWVHDLVWFAKAQHADGTHNDCFQVHNGGRGVSIRGTRLDGYLATDAGDTTAPNRPKTAMSCGMFSPVSATGVLEDFTIADGWLDGGIVQLNFAAWRTAKNVRVIGNRCSSATPVLAKAELPLTIAGNTTVDAAGATVPANGRKNG